MRIFKYQLSLADQHSYQLPQGAVLLSVGLDPGGQLCLWALVDPLRPLEPRAVFIVGTGNPIDDEVSPRLTKQSFVGTVRQGPFMWHIFVD